MSLLENQEETGSYTVNVKKGPLGLRIEYCDKKSIFSR